MAGSPSAATLPLVGVYRDPSNEYNISDIRGKSLVALDDRSIAPRIRNAAGERSSDQSPTTTNTNEPGTSTRGRPGPRRRERAVEWRPGGRAGASSGRLAMIWAVAWVGMVKATWNFPRLASPMTIKVPSSVPWLKRSLARRRGVSGLLRRNNRPNY